jgi:hypothetical protein
MPEACQGWEKCDQDQAHRGSSCGYYSPGYRWLRLVYRRCLRIGHCKTNMIAAGAMLPLAANNVSEIGAGHEGEWFMEEPYRHQKLVRTDDGVQYEVKTNDPYDVSDSAIGELLRTDQTISDSVARVAMSVLGGP